MCNRVKYDKGDIAVMNAEEGWEIFARGLLRKFEMHYRYVCVCEYMYAYMSVFVCAMEISVMSAILLC